MRETLTKHNFSNKIDVNLEKLSEFCKKNSRRLHFLKGLKSLRLLSPLLEAVETMLLWQHCLLKHFWLDPTLLLICFGTVGWHFIEENLSGLDLNDSNWINWIKTKNIAISFTLCNAIIMDVISAAVAKGVVVCFKKLVVVKSVRQFKNTLGMISECTKLFTKIQNRSSRHKIAVVRNSFKSTLDRFLACLLYKLEVN